MFTSTIGRIFLNKFNLEMKSDYSAESFFLEIMYPLFFNDKKYMMTAGNSPLENPKIKWKEMINGKIDYETSAKRSDRFEKFRRKIDEGLVDASLAVGYPTDDTTTGTSGQRTTMELNHTKEDVYSSWIGNALGFGVSGGINILFQDPELLMDIFSGWDFYRKFLKDYPLLKGNQINTWNTLWLSHYYDSRSYDAEYPCYGIENSLRNTDGLLEFAALSWVVLITKISQKRQVSDWLGYLYNIGKSNTTIGFIPFRLEQITRPYELYKKLFGKEQYWQNEATIMELFGGDIGLKRSCEKGEIGIEALMPKGLRKYIEGKVSPQLTKGDSQSSIITFNTYRTWVVAMLNNEQLWEKTKDFANFLDEFGSSSEGKKTDRSNLVKELLGSQSKRAFIDHLAEIIKKSSDCSLCEDMAYEVHRMAGDDVKYLITLIKLHVAVKQQ